MKETKRRIDEKELGRICRRYKGLVRRKKTIEEEIASLRSDIVDYLISEGVKEKSGAGYSIAYSRRSTTRVSQSRIIAAMGFVPSDFKSTTTYDVLKVE